MIARAWRWLGDLLHRGRLERQMNEEMEAHIALHEEALRDQGVPPTEARRRARADFGGVEGIKEEAREALGLRLWDELRGDLRYALRTLRRSPGYVAVSLLTLTLGIGATTAIFSATNALLFRPLPFAEPDRLVHLYETNPEYNWTDADAAPANVMDWRERVAAFEDVAIFSGFRVQFPTVRDGEPTLLSGTQVSGNFFSVLGVRPFLGRLPTWEETFDGRDDIVVLSHQMWATHYGGDSTIIGRMLDAGTRRIEVVGVMPTGFTFPGGGTQFWVPYGWTEATLNAVSFRRAHYVRPIARLAAGVSRDEADAQLQVVVRQLQQEYPATNQVMGAGLMPLRDFLVRTTRQPLMILLAAAGLLLVLATVNIANLTLVRAADREGELAVRQALGAGRFRMARQLVAESLVLSLAGGVLGLAAGWAGLKLLARGLPMGIDGATALALDHRILMVTVTTAVLVGLVAGLAPVLRLGSAWLQGAIGAGARSTTTGPGRNRAVRGLVVVQVALALLLAVGAGLTVRSVLHLRDVDPGFEPEQVVAIQFQVPAGRYPERDQVLAFQQRFADLVAARPGVESVGMVAWLPLAGTNWSGSIKGEGWVEERVGLEVLHRRADAGYFAALGIPLVRGRLFDARDHAGSPPVILVNETFVREHYPGENPIGQRIAYDRVPDSSSVWREIIGIVGDQHQVSPALPVRSEVFEHPAQDWGRGNWFVIRASLPPEVVVAAARGALREVDPQLPLAETRTLTDVWQASMARESLIARLLLAFGSVALLLATVGVYGVSAQAARRRTRELGIRMALGAAQPAVVRMMVGQSLALVLAGVLAGTAAVAGVGGALRSSLHGVTPGDPPTLLSVALVLAAAAALASWIPARRAARVPPSVVLHEG